VSESTGVAGIVAVVVGGVIAYGYGEAAGISGGTFVAIWVTHAVCVFIPFKGVLKK
jgi:hypothetical protein